jgi:SAM-dependent MidA family methyltransferase
MGYYCGQRLKFGLMPEGGSDFVTAPELSPLFGQALAVQVQQALEATSTDCVCEFGAGSGALAEQILQALGDSLQRYWILDLSGTLRLRQAERLARFGDKVQWLDTWPERLEAVVVANELLDALPVTLLHWDGQQWWERGVGVGDVGEGFIWADRPTNARPPVQGLTPHADEDAAMQWAQRFKPGTVVETHPQAEAFMRSLAQRLVCGAAFFVDYGFPEHEYYHPQRTGGTLMCHRAHRADADPLSEVGLKDITAHVNFTGAALAAQGAGLTVLGYTSQARFLMNCGLVDLMASADLTRRSNAAMLITEHEMGELFKVLGLAAGDGFEALGFAQGDRSHTL